jgi:hypothetical protein
MLFFSATICIEHLHSNDILLRKIMKKKIDNKIRKIIEIDSETVYCKILCQNECIVKLDNAKSHLYRM